MIIRGMKGLGDNIYQRAFVRQLGEVQLETPWPELYEDLSGVSFIRSATTLRTQAKNVAAQPSTRWTTARADTERRIAYGQDGIIPGMRKAFGIEPGIFDLPDFGPAPIAGPYALVRPVTVRKEWLAAARNPLPQYVAEAAGVLRQCGVTVVSVADLQEGEEWAVPPLPPADLVFHRGELGVRQLLALVQGASLVIGGIGWILPAAIAARVPAWIICGGQGGYNAPDRITDPVMDLSRLRFAVPDRFCHCTLREHTCDKRIAHHADHFADWLRESRLVA